MNIYRFTTVIKCPKDHRPNAYKVKVKSRRMIWTEVIEDADLELQKEELSQEKYTKALARKIGAKVITLGQHGEFWIKSTHGAV